MELEMVDGREKLVEECEDDKVKVNGAPAQNGRLLPQEKDSGPDNSEVSAVSRASKKSGQFDRLSVPRSLIVEQIVLGRGEFGEVSLAKVDICQVKKLRNHEVSDTEPKLRPVLVKVLTTKDEVQLTEFRRQLDLFSRVKHANIVRLIGLCNESEPHCMLLEHTDWVTARNCVISSKLHLKLSHAALTRGPDSHEYYKMHDQVIPLRWLPQEAVMEGEYSTKSDVYMFAATVWEIYTKAELPFAKLNDNSVLERLKAGTLEWTIPATMPEALGALLKRCWSKSPSERPHFADICEEVNSILQEITSDDSEKKSQKEDDEN
ncbi:hypothetical protein O3G_MSEX012260 [Manduca sexta]|uniref:Protein kinase domain-containing protein n=1 Tax=Manduca sexta TaxID=7130 RepID=A0A921ZNA3_MANSE|nr:hypothetical protein O3G_MSEX012260 [Manduca sexta]